jgi:hypothetical protein
LRLGQFRLNQAPSLRQGFHLPARRRLVWVAVTTNPTAEWIAHQISEAFPWNEAPRYLIRDRDRVYGTMVTRRVRAMGIRDKPIACGSPWQNCFAERLIGSIRRECLDHFVILGEAHLRRILGAYAAYYNVSRTHRSLDKDAPFSRPVQRAGSIHSHAILGGLRHHYVRVCPVLFSPTRFFGGIEQVSESIGDGNPAVGQGGQASPVSCAN